jgi:hypothetical protein
MKAILSSGILKHQCIDPASCDITTENRDENAAERSDLPAYLPMLKCDAARIPAKLA